MNHPFFYFSVLAVYFIFLVVIGLISKKGTKSSSDYLIGGRKIGAMVSALSFVAAYFSSVVIIGGGAFGYKYGLSTLWIAAINVLVGCFLAWLVLGKKTRELTKKLDAVTLPDFFAKRYRLPFARIFISIVICLLLIIYNVSILKGLGDTFHVLLEIPYMWGVVLSGVIVLVYVSFGGYLAVVWTGFIQAIIMGTGLILLLVNTLKGTGGMTAGITALSSINTGLVETPGIWGFPGLISYVLVVSFGVWGMPQMLARFYSIKSNKAIRTGTLIATIGGAMAFIPYLVGALARTRFPELSNADQAIPMMVNAFMPPAAIAIFFVGVIAAGMSTFSSVLIISSGAMVRDLFKKSFSMKISEDKEIRWSMTTNLIVGLISILLALRPPGLVLTLTAFSWAVIASTCLAPFLLGLYWNGTTRTGVIASMIGGFTVAIVWTLLKQPFGLHGFIPGVAISFALLVIVSLLGKDKISIKDITG
jgi:solute:Na+ symporter, SSS family